MKIVRRDWQTSIDCRYLAYMDRKNMDRLSRRRITKRRRGRFLRWVRGIR